MYFLVMLVVLSFNLVAAQLYAQAPGMNGRNQLVEIHLTNFVVFFKMLTELICLQAIPAPAYPVINQKLIRVTLPLPTIGL